MGDLHYRQGNYQEAKRFFLKAKKRSVDADVLRISVDATRFLSLTFAELGDFSNAYTYHVEYKTLYDSLQKEANLSRMSDLEEKYQNEQKQKEIELLSAENQIASLELQKQENLRNYLIMGSFLLVLLIGITYSRYQVKARANAKLKELDHLKTNFFTNISHEFRTPLTLILSPVQKLLDKKNDNETQQELSIIHRNASHLTELINQLMDLSKLEAGKLSLQVRQENLKEFLTLSAASFDSLAEAQQIEFQITLDDAPNLAYFDRDKVQKVLNNLLSNAFKFTPPEGKLALTTEVKNNNIYISITDSGPGITDTDQELIFQRFQQSNTTDANTTGTGVGLTLSKELAMLHKGDISVKSTLGEGATFTFYFPINKNAYSASDVDNTQAQAAILATQQNGPIVALEEPREVHEDIILIVEDNTDLRYHIASLLKDTFTIKQALNGKEGIEIARQIIPDIIISDLMMPEVDGIELSNKLKADEKTSHIPIILLTAKADREAKLEGLQTGADDFLTKPFDNDELLIRVNNLIRQRKTLQEKYAKKISLLPSEINIESPDEIFIQKALKVVDQNLSNSAFTVEAFQLEMGMSRMQLHRKLKGLTNFSASEFIRDLRLQRASDLLSREGINVSEVAYSCGFNSISYFTQCFKQKYDVSPSKYQEKTA